MSNEGKKTEAFTNKEYKQHVLEIWKVIISGVAILSTLGVAIFATKSITTNIHNQIASQTLIAQQKMEAIQQLISIQQQIVTQSQIANQEIVTLQPRDGDVIIKDDDSYKLVQLIKLEDITVSTSL